MPSELLALPSNFHSIVHFLKWITLDFASTASISTLPPFSPRLLSHLHPSSALPPTLLACQGFTRPKVLLLLPQRNFAFKLIRRLVALAMHETRADSVQGKEKFVKQFTEAEVGALAHLLTTASADPRIAPGCACSWGAGSLGRADV